MFDKKENKKVSGKCPECGGEVVEFTACHCCQSCKLVWSITLKEWETCNVCVFADGGTCNNCYGANFGHTTKITGKGKCENWTERK